MSFFDMKITSLAPPVLFDLADHIRTFAEQIENVANENERRLCERRNAGSYKRSVRAASREFSSLVENGMSTRDALDEAATKHCVKPEAISIMVTLFKAKQRKIEKLNRDRSVMKMWRAGHTAPEIAHRHANINVRTVQRIVKEFKQI